MRPRSRGGWPFLSEFPASANSLASSVYALPCPDCLSSTETFSVSSPSCSFWTFCPKESRVEDRCALLAFPPRSANPPSSNRVLSQTGSCPVRRPFFLPLFSAGPLPVFCITFPLPLPLLFHQVSWAACRLLSCFPVSETMLSSGLVFMIA